MKNEDATVRCPGPSHERLTATKSWRGANVEGKPVWYGIIPAHHHGGILCDWSGLVAKVEDKGG